MSRTEEIVTKKKAMELRHDLQDGHCCVCTNELPFMSATVVRSSRLLGLKKGMVGDRFRVCGQRCKRFLDSKDKLRRPPQQLIIRRISSAMLGTDVLVGDKVETIRDTSANRDVVAGEGIVLDVVLDSERDCGEIHVNLPVLGTVRVWASGLRRIIADENAGRTRRDKLPTAPSTILAEHCPNQSARIEELEASADAQKQRAVGADVDRRAARKLRLALNEAAAMARQLKEGQEADARTVQRQFVFCYFAFGPRAQ
jgi:hypothetical protein